MTAPLLLIVIMALVTSSLSSDILQSQIKSSFLKSHVLSTMKQQIKTNQNNNQRLLLDVSPYKWFQEIYYSSSDCSGQPYRMYEFVLGTCFKDSPKTSFLVNLISDADQLDYYEFSDDKCEKVANSSSTDFQGSKFEDVDTQDPTVSCEVLTDEKNNEVLSLRTVYFDTPYNPIYPFSGQIDRYGHKLLS